jgi:hypothetical protein
MAGDSSELMKLYDNYKAPLAAGAYRFVLQQTVIVGDEPERHYYRDQSLEIVAPRYLIDPDEVHAFFPPAGGVAEYQNVLPHVILRSRNLPWERTLWDGEKREPWLALLVLSEEDITTGRAVIKNGTVADLQPQGPDDLNTDFAKLDTWTRLELGESVVLPKFTRKEDANTPVRLLDLDLKLFLQLCPRRDDLPLLAHIRQVDTANKVPLEMVANGEFSVLVANRFPQKGPNTVHLISLEGWDNLIGKSPQQNLPATRVRLITLANWTFICDSTGRDTFAGLMSQLRKSSNVFGIKLPAPTTHAHVNEALARGYVPLDYKPLDSTTAMAWYRGPLSPLRRHRNTKTFLRADEALIFDDQTGVMDVSYAAAWELGRLLALSSPAFSKGMRLFVESYQNSVEFTNQLNSFLQLHSAAFTEPQKNEQVAIATDLIEWLARLVMLYPVPFHYLIPHASLLPPESVRFFHLDDNWIDALLDGALSLAARVLPADQDITARNDLQLALSKIVYQYRLRLQGQNPEWKPQETYMEIPKSGFLLRSSIVTNWPGIEVTATSSGAPDQTMPNIVRFDEVADGVLFCLARGSLDQLVFREPREGLTFGVSSKGEVEFGQPVQTVNVKSLRRSEALDGVVDVVELGKKLGCAGSAQFAVRMIRKPEEQVIEWK